MKFTILSDYYIVNNSGQMILNGNNNQVDVSMLSNGIYFIYVTTRQGTQQAKFIKI